MSIIFDLSSACILKKNKIEQKQVNKVINMHVCNKKHKSIISVFFYVPISFSFRANSKGKKYK